MSDSTDLPPASPFTRRTAAMLARGPFGRYALGTAVSQTGIWMQNMAQSWVMASLTKDFFELSWVNAAFSLPALCLTMYGGTVADRYDKRKILIATQVVQLMLAVAIGALVITKHIEIWHILVAAGLLGISGAFEMPADAALVPELVDKENIANAIAVDRSIFHGTRLLGPALAGLVIRALGAGMAFFANALTFTALIAALLSIKPRPQGDADEEEQRSSGMKAGIDYVRQDRPTMAMMSLMAANALCILPFMSVMIIPYAKRDLGLDANFVGYLISASGVGSLVASIGMLRVPRSARIYWMTLAAVDIVVTMLALAFAQNFWQAAVALMFLSMGTSLNYGLANTTVQERAPGPLRGRVMSLAMLAFVGIMPFSSLIITKIADVAHSARYTVVGCGIGYGLIAFYLLLGPARRSTTQPAPQSSAVPAGTAS